MKKAAEAAVGYARATGERTVELVHRSPGRRKAEQAAFTSSSGRGRTRQNCDCGTERQGANRLKPRRAE